MNRRSWIALGAVVVVACSAAYAVAVSDSITHENFDRIIAANMTEVEVIALLGRPPDEVADLRTIPDAIPDLGIAIPIKIWKGRGTEMFLHFAEDGTVSAFRSWFNEEQTLIEKLRHWWTGRGGVGRKSTSI